MKILTKESYSGSIVRNICITFGMPNITSACFGILKEVCFVLERNTEKKSRGTMGNITTEDVGVKSIT